MTPAATPGSRAGSTTAATTTVPTASTAMAITWATTVARNWVMRLMSPSTRVTSSPGVRSRWKPRSARSTWSARSWRSPLVMSQASTVPRQITSTVVTDEARPVAAKAAPVRASRWSGAPSTASRANRLSSTAPASGRAVAAASAPP